MNTILTILLFSTDPFEQLADPTFVPPPAVAVPVDKVVETPKPTPIETPQEDKPAKKDYGRPRSSALSLFNAALVPMDHGGIGVAAGWAQVEGANFLALAPNLRFQGKDYAIELGASVNLTLSSADPALKMWHPRLYDWDEIRDYFKILRDVRIGNLDSDGNGFLMFVGSMDGVTLRQGSLMRRYSNNILADKTRTALGFRAKDAGYETQMFLSDVTFGSAILGVDVGVRPFSKFDNRVGSSFEFGASYALESFTPTDFKVDATTGVREANVQREPQMNGRGLHGFTADIGLAVVNFDMVRLKVFSEFGMLIAFGNSISAGLDLDVRLGFVRLGARGEYRNFGDKWMPGYFGSFHEVERFSFLSSNPVVQPKFAMLDSLTQGARQHSGSAELRVGLGHYARLLATVDAGGYLVAQQFSLHVEATPFSWLTLFGTYQKRNFARAGELFTFGDNDMLRTGLSIAPLSWLVISAAASRTFIWNVASDSGLGNMAATWSAGATVGVRYSLGD